MPGQFYDKHSKLNYNYFRDYNPLTGKYMQSDPIGLLGGINTYGYALQNPINYYDPNGKAATAVQGAIAGGAIGGPPGAVIGGIIGAGIGLGGYLLFDMLNGDEGLPNDATNDDTCPPDDFCTELRKNSNSYQGRLLEEEPRG